MRILKSFKYAIRGILYCLRNERNMRFHAVVALYIMIFSRFFELSRESFLLLILTISAVMTAEMVNTAIEGISDIVASDYNTMAKVVKDLAAGAVMVSAIFSVIIGLMMFNDLNAYIRIWNYFYIHPLMFLLFSLSIACSIIYVYIGTNGIKNKLKILKLRKK